MGRLQCYYCAGWYTLCSRIAAWTELPSSPLRNLQLGHAIYVLNALSTSSSIGSLSLYPHRPRWLRRTLSKTFDDIEQKSNRSLYAAGRSTVRLIVFYRPGILQSAFSSDGRYGQESKGPTTRKAPPGLRNFPHIQAPAAKHPDQLPPKERNEVVWVDNPHEGARKTRE